MGCVDTRELIYFPKDQSEISGLRSSLLNILTNKSSLDILALNSTNQIDGGAFFYVSHCIRVLPLNYGYLVCLSSKSYVTSENSFSPGFKMS